MEEFLNQATEVEDMSQQENGQNSLLYFKDVGVLLMLSTRQ